MAHSAGVLLLASVAGYWVLERAEHHKGSLKRVGQLLGWLIIVVSLVGVACRVWSVVACTKMPGGKGGYCPFMPPASSQAPQ